MMEETIDGKSLDITAEKIAQLRTLFPEAFTEDKIDFKRLKDVLGDQVSFGNEHYELSWAGKAEARKEVQKQTTATLIPDRESSINFDNTENIFIEGENLEVLRVLQKSYFGKVKMIYIDPPYNTGNDSFVYPDDYSERKDAYNKRTGITNEDGLLNKQDLWKKNTKENGQFHSVWLSMMYPRLYLARNLLKEDGVIFVSIDDNEQANLKSLMNEIFGEENFIDCIVWKKRYGGGAKEKYLVTLHEYVLLYAKDIDKINPIFIANSEESINRYYKLKDQHYEKKGGFRTHPLEATKSMGDRPNLVFPIIAPDGIEVLPKRQWLWSKERVNQALAKDEVAFLKDKDGNWSIHTKQYLKDDSGNVRQSKAFSIIEDVFTQHGTNEINEIFENAQLFPFPKPTSFILKLLSIGTNEKEEDIILDFFAGSCTTAQAILEKNMKGESKLKFILIQIPEPVEENREAYKSGFKTISEIGKVRMEKVIERFKIEYEEELNFKKDKLTLGFQAYKLSPSNFKQWQSDIQGKENILQQLEIFTNSTKPEKDKQNMLTEILLKSGKPLTVKVETVQTNEGSFFSIPEYNTCICLEGFGTDTRNKLYNRKPKEVVVLNTLFQNDEFLSNTKLEFKEANIKLTLL